MSQERELVIVALVKALEQEWPSDTSITDIIDSTVDVFRGQPATQHQIDACYTFFGEATIEEFLRDVELVSEADTRSLESDRAAADTPATEGGELK